MSAPSAAVEDVVAAVAGEAVVEPIAGAVDIAGAGQDQVLDLVLEVVADRAVDDVGAAAGRLDDDVEAVVDEIGIVAAAADHGVAAGAAVEDVGARIAGEDVGEAVAGAVEVAGAGEDEPLDLGAENVVQRALDGVGAAARQLGHDVAGIVDDVGVVAERRPHGVGADAAVEDVGGIVADQDVGEALPVPLIALMPVRVRFSKLLRSV